MDALDFGVIDALRALEARRPGMLKRLVGTFVSRAPGQLSSMEKAVADVDWATLERLAHDMKSDSGNLGARRLSALCEELQTAARDGMRPDGCADLVPLVVAEFGAVRAAFAAAGLLD